MVYFSGYIVNIISFNITIIQYLTIKVDLFLEKVYSDYNKICVLISDEKLQEKLSISHLYLNKLGATSFLTLKDKFIGSKIVDKVKMSISVNEMTMWFNNEDGIVSLKREEHTLQSSDLPSNNLEGGKQISLHVLQYNINADNDEQLAKFFIVLDPYGDNNIFILVEDEENENVKMFCYFSQIRTTRKPTFFDIEFDNYVKKRSKLW